MLYLLSDYFSLQMILNIITLLAYTFINIKRYHKVDNFNFSLMLTLTLSGSICVTATLRISNKLTVTYFNILSFITLSFMFFV